jgi:hypothetical protein
MAELKHRGYCFFNFGGGCALRLLAAVTSLRLYDRLTPIHFFLQEKDEWNLKLEPSLLALAQPCSVQHLDFSGEAKKNLKCAIKPMLFRNSPFEQTLLFDGDLLFQDSPLPLFGLMEALGADLLVTRFSTWNTDGGKMQKRVRNFYPWLRPREQQLLDARLPGHDKIPAINIGVLGLAVSDCTCVLDDWEWLMKKKSGMHLADEVAANCIMAIHRERVVAAPSQWNESCLFKTDDPEKAKILHYHGNKHCGYRDSSWRWIRHVAKMLDDRPGLESVLSWPDRAFQAFVQDNPNWRRVIAKYMRILKPGWEG